MTNRWAFLVLAYWTGSISAAPEFRAPRLEGDGAFTLETTTDARELGRRGGFVLRELSASERDLAERRTAFQLQGNLGGGADVLNLTLVQTRFRATPCILPDTCEAGPCNTVDILWEETTPNVLGLNVFVNGLLIGTVPGAGQLPTIRGVSIGGFSPELHTIALQEIRVAGVPPAPQIQGTILVLDEQPFADPTNPQCTERDVVADGRCTLDLTVENDSPPDAYRVFLERTFVGNAAGSTSPLPFPGLEPGEYLISLAGLLSNADGNYEGCPVEFKCVVACERSDPCLAPARLTVFQTVYGSEDDGNEVQFSWQNGETLYNGGVRVFVNDDLLAMVPADPAQGNPSQGVAGDLPAGDTTIGVQGDCTGDGESAVTEALIPLLTASPHTRPIEPDSLTCTWSPADNGTTEANWANADPSVFVLVYLEREGRRTLLGIGDSNTVRATIGNTLPTDTVLLQFVAPFDGFLYGSELLRCTPGSGPRFIRSFCNAAPFIAEGEAPDVLPRPDISSASFLLNFLFLGGPEPACREACDSDGNREVDISDASFLLNFLFLGGNAPPGWADTGAGFDPACEAAGPEADCETGHEACGG